MKYPTAHTRTKNYYMKAKKVKVFYLSVVSTCDIRQKLLTMAEMYMEP